MVHSEDELIFGIVLAAEGNIVVIGLKILAGERDQMDTGGSRGGRSAGGLAKNRRAATSPAR